MSATLKNIDRQPLVLMLDHPTFATREHGWTRSTAQFAQSNDDGTRVVKEVRRSYPGTLTLMPGETVEGLPNDIEKCSQVARMRLQRKLQVTIVADVAEE